MGLLQKIKSALGLDGASSSDTRRSSDVDVTVEREPSTADEDAVKGTDTSGSESGQDTATDDAETASEDGETDDAETTDTDTDDVETASEDVETADTDTDDAETASENVETDDTVSDDAATDDSSSEVTDDADEETADADDASPEAEDDTGDEEPEGSTDPVTELNGIGPAYADRLAGQGIDTVGELAVADPEAIADETDLGANRVAGWVEQAREY